MASEVKDIFEKSTSIERKYEKEIKTLKWDYADVLFSFRGIYVIGLSIYYKNNFEWRGKILRPTNPKPSNPKQQAYSRAFLKANYDKYGDLNELKELKEFISVYNSIGNLIPIWPGGNVHRGQNKCYDIPSIYFNNSKIKAYTNNFFQIFYKKEDTYFHDVINGKYSNLTVENLIEFTESDYKKFLVYITTIIKDREELLKGWL